MATLLPFRHLLSLTSLSSVGKGLCLKYFSKPLCGVPGGEALHIYFHGLCLTWKQGWEHFGQVMVVQLSVVLFKEEQRLYGPASILPAP